MFLVDLLFAFFVALLLSLLFVPFIGRGSYRRSRGQVRTEQSANGQAAVAAILFFFLILFFATWAGGIWVVPIGPAAWGSYWIPFILVGIVVALLLAAATEPTRRYYVRHGAERHPEAETEERIQDAAAVAFGAAFWILLIGLIVAVALGYALD